MNLPALLVTDLHLTPKPDDEYRWGLFPWLRDICRKHKIRTLIFMGDTTDAKDYHSSTLVNRILACILMCKEEVDEIIILLGNHDYLRDGHAFFEFLNTYPGITFVSKPLAATAGVDRASLFLPHTKDLSTWDIWDFSKYDYVFMHQTVSGSFASNGQQMEGELNATFKALPKIQIYSGDIHVPQDVGDVRYVGSPYHVHFGDKFIPRCLIINEDDSETEIHFETISRFAITATSFNDFVDQVTQRTKKGDQIKVVIELSEEDKYDWDRIRKDILLVCKTGGITVHDFKMKVKPTTRIKLREAREVRGQLSADSILTRFIQAEDLGADILDIGLELIA
jgi:hypothetical protein